MVSFDAGLRLCRKIKTRRCNTEAEAYAKTEAVFEINDRQTLTLILINIALNKQKWPTRSDWREVKIVPAAKNTNNKNNKNNDCELKIKGDDDVVLYACVKWEFHGRDVMINIIFLLWKTKTIDFIL